jgi:hypothetical protein
LQLHPLLERKCVETGCFGFHRPCLRHQTLPFGKDGWFAFSSAQLSAVSQFIQLV